MRLTDHDLKQLSQEYLTSLSPEQLLHLSRKMLDDLRDARDRLDQTPHNSSRPSGSYAPWQRTVSGDKEEPAEEATKPEPKAEKEADSREQPDKSAANARRSKRKASKPRSQ